LPAALKTNQRILFSPFCFSGSKKNAFWAKKIPAGCLLLEEHAFHKSLRACVSL
jgi:hypothetical protein